MSNNKNRILTELPRYIEGRYKGKVNCQAMEGMDLELLYDDEVYSVKIVEYVKYTKGNNPKFKIRYKENTTLIDCNSFINSCRFGGVLTEWKVKKTNNRNKILSKLPFNGNKINREKMVGLALKLLYDNEVYNVEVMDYVKEFGYNKFKIKYNDEIKIISCCHFIEGKFGSLLNKRTSDFKIEIGKTFGNITIIDNEYKKDRKGGERKWYKYKCNKCKYIDGTFYEGWISESNLIKGQGCNCCHNRVAVLGINTIWDTDRWMCKEYGISEEDAKTYTRGSNKRIVVTCPDCKKQKEIKINNLNKHNSINCENCSDNFSYPERFMINILNQLNIEYIRQYKPDYLKRDGEGQKSSDFYLPQYKRIIETDGKLGHKGGVAFDKTVESLQKSIETDRWKDEQHLLHGLKTIRINCFESNMEYIKRNILNSELNKLFDLSKIDWLKCDSEAQRSLVKEVCEYWNNKEELEKTRNLAEYFGISDYTVRRYLKRGTKLGWCKFIPHNGKRIAVFKDGKPYIPEGRKDNTFESGCEVERLSKENLNMFGRVLFQANISKVCLGELKSTGGFVFKYINLE